MPLLVVIVVAVPVSVIAPTPDIARSTISNTVFATVPQAPLLSPLPGLDRPLFSVYVVGMSLPYKIVSVHTSARSGVPLLYTPPTDGATSTHPGRSFAARTNVANDPVTFAMLTVVGVATVTVDALAILALRFLVTRATPETVDAADIPARRLRVMFAELVTADTLDIPAVRGCATVAAPETVDTLDIPAVRFRVTLASDAIADVLDISAVRSCVTAAETSDVLAIALDRFMIIDAALDMADVLAIAAVRCFDTRNTLDMADVLAISAVRGCDVVAELATVDALEIPAVRLYTTYDSSPIAAPRSSRRLAPLWSWRINAIGSAFSG